MSAPATRIARLEAIVGSARVCPQEDHTTAFAIDACQPAVVVCPETVEQVTEIVTLAGRDGLALVPWGQGTQMHLGKAPERYDLALSLAGLSRVVEYDVANLTVIAEAGLPLCDLYRVSVPERQFPPLGFPGSRASLGGLLVTNTSGVKWARYGPLRDLLLGVRVVLPDGSVVQFGGRVVKNVAGYDMNKLFVGSLGAFGVVLETTYRLAALPEDDRALAVVLPDLTRAVAAAAEVQGSQLLPSALILLPAEVAADCDALSSLPMTMPQVVLVMNFDGMHEAVERQIGDSRAIGQRHGAIEATLLSGEALLKFWEFQDAWRAAPGDTGRERLQVRFGTLPSCLEDLLRQVTVPQPFCQPGVQWLADYSHGQILAHLTLSASDDAKRTTALSGWLQQIRRQLRDLSGYAVVEYAPAGLRQQLDIWGEPPGYLLLRLYKRHFDPHAVLNPGRYVAGL